MIDIRSDATVEAVAKALCKARYTDGTTWESLNKYIQRDWLDYACLAIEALVGQLQMSETQLRERVKYVSFNHENPYQERAAMQGYERALRDLGLVRDNEEDN